MAINVICPGCMTRFQVDDRFAGKKGPCPKCGHIIEIPKENLVVHAPDDITTDAAGNPTVRRGQDVRPILQTRFIFTKLRVFLGLVGIAAVIAVCVYLSSWQPGSTKNMIGLAGMFLLGFPLAAFGYMMVREDDDLEIFLGNELYKRSFFTACCFGVSWLALEWLISYLDPGPLVFIYIVPVAILGTLGVMMIFDTDFGKAVTIYCLLLACVIGLRGIMFSPYGWIWAMQPVQVRAASGSSVPLPASAVSDKAVAPDSTQKSKTADSPKKDAKANTADAKTSSDKKDLPNAKTPPQTPAQTPAQTVNPKKKPLDRQAPDPRKGLKR
ncbi:MAG: hypothetical protein PHQ75_11525 [Thermoguttaceae bacterium]|nr:hypothetical protein [Thermoguttaceae bacterium]